MQAVPMAVLRLLVMLQAQCFDAADLAAASLRLRRLLIIACAPRSRQPSLPSAGSREIVRPREYAPSSSRVEVKKTCTKDACQ